MQLRMLPTQERMCQEEMHGMVIVPSTPPLNLILDSTDFGSLDHLPEKKGSRFPVIDLRPAYNDG